LDAEPLPQFRAGIDSPGHHDLDESEVVETLERPAVRVSGHLPPPARPDRRSSDRIRAVRPPLPPPNPPPARLSSSVSTLTPPPARPLAPRTPAALYTRTIPGVAPPPRALGASAPRSTRLAPPPLDPSPPPAYAVATKRDTVETTPSLAPVAMSTSLPLPSRAADPTMQLRRAPHRPTGIAAALALVVSAVLAGSIVALVALVHDSSLASPSALVERLKGRTNAEPSAPAAEPSAPAAEPSAPAAEPSAPAAEPSAPAAEPSAPAAEALAQAAAPEPARAPQPGSTVVVAPATAPVLEPDRTLVRLPRSSKGHRIFVDGRVVGSGPAPVKIKCGKRKIKIGSGGKPRVAELPCGGELTLE